MTNLSPSEAELEEKIVMHLVTSMPGMSVEYRSYAEEAATEIMQLFTRYSKAQTLAVIGEDEDPANGCMQPGIYYRNNFRAEQRQLLEQKGES